MAKESKLFTLKELYLKNDCKPFWAEDFTHNSKRKFHCIGISPDNNWALGWYEDGKGICSQISDTWLWKYCPDPTKPKPQLRVWINERGQISIEEIAPPEVDGYSFSDCTAELAEALAPYIKELLGEKEAGDE